MGNTLRPAPHSARLLAFFLFLAMIAACGGEKDAAGNEAPASSRTRTEAPAPDSPRKRESALTGTWSLDSQALREALLKDTREDLAAEGMDPEAVPQELMASLERSVSACFRRLALNGDGTFETEIAYDVPGTRYQEVRRGRWHEKDGLLVLETTRIGEEAIEPPEVETIEIRGDRLYVDFFGHTLPLVRGRDDG